MCVCVGYTHELVTIKEVGNVVLEGFPKTMHSWFPGYAWTIARCSNCFLQLVHRPAYNLRPWRCRRRACIVCCNGCGL